MSAQLLCGDAVFAVGAVDFMCRERRGAAVQCGGKNRGVCWQQRARHSLLSCSNMHTAQTQCSVYCVFNNNNNNNKSVFVRCSAQLLFSTPLLENRDHLWSVICPQLQLHSHLIVYLKSHSTIVSSSNTNPVFLREPPLQSIQDESLVLLE